MFDYFRQKIIILNRFFKANQKTLFFLLAIVALGTYLRAYNFYGFQRFDEDHVRDAQVIQKLDQDRNFIIAGPVAKYTEYHLGPIYYYFIYIAFEFFGKTPGSLAYPALFFSVLSIPLFYFVFKKFFTEWISLAATAIYAVSFNSIEFARFEWNCNLIPFFTLAFIYSLLKIIEQRKDPKILWPALLGIIIGIGVQLHTMIIFTFLPILAIFFGYFLWKKCPLWKSLFLIIALVIFLNIPSVTWDIRHHGENTKAFLEAVYKENVFMLPPSYYLDDLKCYTQGGSYALSPANQTSSCEFLTMQKKDLYPFYLANVAATLLFSIGGIVFLFYHLKHEKNPNKKIFLQISALYLLFTFIVFLPMAHSFDKRYFIVAFFIPYLFLGFWIKMLIEKLKLAGIIISSIIIIALFTSDLFLVKRLFIANPNPFREENEYCGIDLVKSEEVSNYIMIIAPSYGAKKIYLSTPLYMRGYRCVMEYFIENKSDLEIIPVTKSDQEQLDKNSILFLVEENNYANLDFNQKIYSLIDTKQNSWYKILILKKNN